MDTMQESREKNASGALILLRCAELEGDDLRMELARAILAECGYPGGENARSVDEVQADIDSRNARHD